MQEKMRPLAFVCGVEWYDTVDSEQRYSRGDLQGLKYLFSLMTNSEEGFSSISFGFHIFEKYAVNISITLATCRT